VIRVLYVNHTATVGGAEHSLLTLLGQRPDGISACVACPPGPLAEAVSDLGYPTLSLPETTANLKLHPIRTPRAVGEIARGALAIERYAIDNKSRSFTPTPFAPV